MELIGAVVRVACLDCLAIEKPEYRLTEYRIDEDGPTAEAFLDETDFTEDEIAAIAYQELSNRRKPRKGVYKNRAA